MSDVVIKAEGLGKRYLIGHQTETERYTALRDVIGRTVKNYVRQAKTAFSGQQILFGNEIEEFWALKDLDFEIRRGDTVGIIGRNGAGKSTLLKVLSRITEPSAGQVTIKGRIASLLEVGTGFHPELTGRENIYLNGAILGMTRTEIKAKFDEIVAFAQVERFLDTPVKRYSSGMYVRLAFSVAAHLEPEILVVDEVLAVGDAEFQRKCLGKMDDVAKTGRTVLFVSHNMAMIDRLCSRVIQLKRGQLDFDGDTSEGTQRYLQSATSDNAELPDPDKRPGNGNARIVSIDCPPAISFGDPLKVCIKITVKENIDTPDIRMTIYDAGSAAVSALSSYYLNPQMPSLKAGEDVDVEIEIPFQHLNAGFYSINLAITETAFGQQSLADRIEHAARFQIDIVDPFGTGKSPAAGSIVLPQIWRLNGDVISEAPMDFAQPISRTPTSNLAGNS